MSDLNPSSTPTANPPSASSELSELKARCNELQSQTQTLQIALLIVAGALGSFFYLESSRNGQALAVLRPQAAQVVEASKTVDPAVNRFLGQLAEFTKTHQDFGPILAKYIGRPAGPAAPTTAAPVPTTAPAKK
jgi:hypothetical protein